MPGMERLHLEDAFEDGPQVAGRLRLSVGLIRAFRRQSTAALLLAECVEPAAEAVRLVFHLYSAFVTMH